MANIPGSWAAAQGTYQQLSDLSMLSVRWGTWPTFIEKYPSLVAQSYILQAEGSGAGLYTPTRQFRHWEPNGKTLPQFVAVAGVTGGGAGAAITVTLTAGSHISSGALSPVAIGYVFENSRSGQVYRVSAVNKTVAGAHTATLVITDSAVIASVNINDVLIYRGPVLREEASTALDSEFRHEVAVTGECRTIRDDMTFTDRNLFEKTENPSGNYKFFNAQVNGVMTPRFVAIQEQDLMLGVSANNLGVNNSAGRGLVPQVRAGGTQVPGSAVDAAFWQSVKRRVAAEGYSNEYDLLADTELYMQIQDYIGTAFNNGAIIYEEPASSKKPMDIARNYKSFNIHGVKFNLLDYYYFNQHASHGVPLASTTSYDVFGLFIPQGEAPDAKTGAPVKRFAVRYEAENEGDAAVQSFEYGGMADANKNGTLTKSVVMHTNKGIETFAVNGYLYYEG